MSETLKEKLYERWPLLTARQRRGREFLVLAFAVQVRNRLGEARCTDGLIVTNSFANNRKCLTEQVFPLPWHLLLALGPSAWRPVPHTGSRGLDSAKHLLSELKRLFFYGWFLRGFGVGAR